ncbi:MAG: ABC transporter ATP-binding protein [Acidimicrobiales bacterium]
MTTVAAGAATGPAIEARRITKRFPDVVANESVDFAVERGEVHALLGENGAGKSTLAAVLSGLYEPDDGDILIGGEHVHLRNPREGLAHGVGMVHQHFRLVERFSVAENVALGDLGQPIRLPRHEVEQQVTEVSERYGLPVDPRACIADLSVGQRQRVEIVKLLHRGATILLLDEPTAVLTPQEVEALFATVRGMAAGGASIVFISHKLAEVMEVSDRVTVLRDGRVTGEVRCADTDQRELARMMVGRPVELLASRATGADRSDPGDVALLAEEVVLERGGIRVLDGIDLCVRPGEIVGVAGVAGNGQRELAEVLAGIEEPTSGSVTVNGKTLGGHGPSHARRLGLAFVPEDRLGTGLVPDMDMVDNQMLTRERRFFLDRRSARREVEEAIAEFEIKTPGPGSDTRVLSGGNAQKALLARELGRQPGRRVVIVASPTRGLDIGATELVRFLLHRVREDGGAVVLISEDLDEVRSLADRMMVLYQGRIRLEGDPDQLPIEDIGLAMAGVGP